MKKNLEKSVGYWTYDPDGKYVWVPGEEGDGWDTFNPNDPNY